MLPSCGPPNVGSVLITVICTWEEVKILNPYKGECLYTVKKNVMICFETIHVRSNTKFRFVGIHGCQKWCAHRLWCGRVHMAVWSYPHWHRPWDCHQKANCFTVWSKSSDISTKLWAMWNSLEKTPTPPPARMPVLKPGWVVGYFLSHSSATCNVNLVVVNLAGGYCTVDGRNPATVDR